MAATTLSVADSRLPLRAPGEDADRQQMFEQLLETRQAVLKQESEARAQDSQEAT